MRKVMVGDCPLQRVVSLLVVTKSCGLMVTLSVVLSLQPPALLTKSCTKATWLVLVVLALVLLLAVHRRFYLMGNQPTQRLITKQQNLAMLLF